MQKLLGVLVTLIFPLAVSAEPLTAHSNLEIRVIIPPMLMVTTDEHPSQVSGSATQLLTLRSNNRNTCVFVSARGYAGAWRATTTDTAWSTMTTGEGWRFCTTKLGDLSLRLEHLFLKPADYWPVSVTVSGQP